MNLSICRNVQTSSDAFVVHDNGARAVDGNLTVSKLFSNDVFVDTGAESERKADQRRSRSAIICTGDLDDDDVRLSV